jgi:hypothetical protein
MGTVKKISKGSRNGKGEIKKAAEHFADCTYQINVEQEEEISASLNSVQVVPGRLILTGIVTINQSELLKPGVLEGMNSGGAFTLHLSDGYKINTSFSPILEANNPLNGKYKIIPMP